MTVQTTATKIREDGNGVKTAFTFAFKIYASTDIKVYKVVKATGAATLQVLNTDYTVSFTSGVAGTGTVTYTVAPTSLQESFITADLAYTQGTDIPDRGGIRESQIEKPLDRLTLLIQQVKEIVDRCVQFAITSTQTGMTMPEPEASKILGWNATADGMENYDNPAVAMAAAQAAQAAAELAQSHAETAETNAETAETNAETAETNAELAADRAEAAANALTVLTATLTISGGAVAVDASRVASGGVFTLTAGDNFTLSNPTNPVDGKKLIFRIKQDATGSRVITLGTKYKVGAGIGTLTLSTTANHVDAFGAIYNATDDIWSIVAFDSNITAVS